MQIYLDPEIVEKLEREVFEPGYENFYLLSWSPELSIYKSRTKRKMSPHPIFFLSQISLVFSQVTLSWKLEDKEPTNISY